jgi:hypothetical protein
MPTNIKTLPRYECTIEASNNEDLILALDFAAADNVTPIALTGIAFRFTVRADPDDVAAAIAATTAAGTLAIGTGSPDPTNRLLFIIPQSAMATVAPGAYIFDVQAIADGVTLTVAYGQILVAQGVSR